MSREATRTDQGAGCKPYLEIQTFGEKALAEERYKDYRDY